MTAIAPTARAPRPAPRLAPRVSPGQGLRQSFSLAWRTLVSIKHNPGELLDFSIQPVMFVLLFTFVFGGAISGSPHSYLMFALPGIIVQNALFATLNTGMGLSTDLDKGFLDRLRTLPIARFAPLTGRILADWSSRPGPSRCCSASARPWASGSAPPRCRCWARSLLLLIFSLAVSWIIVLVSMVAASPEKVQIFGFVVLFPLTFTSDAFVRTASMPGALQAWVKANPVTLLADATRGLLVSGPVATPLLQSLLWAAGITAVFAPLAVRAFRRRT